ncbi:MAG TPA: amidase [Verrucomicrobiae bacterium]|nr:amidase [Verrucomicrobiae bacterium]
MMQRRKFLGLVGWTGLAAAATPTLAWPYGPPVQPVRWGKHFELEELGIAQLQDLIDRRKASSVSLVRLYLKRIEAIDRNGPHLNSVIELNPDALSIAAELDRERTAHGKRGPLHGIPVLIKDNIDTHDRMTTTAGSLALKGSKPLRDAFLVERLRAAGAVLLGKTNLSEWANFRGSNSTSGWSGRGGQTRNPYALDRNPSGSSSGSAAAVSANLCAVAVGTETDGSVLSPSSFTGIVGLKPTVGLVSRSGIIPIAHSQDTAGPMARTVADAAILLGALTGTDPDDPATAESSARAQRDYTKFLDAAGLKGMRLGVARNFFGFQPVDELLQQALAALKQCGAELVDPVEIRLRELGTAEIEVLRYEMKADMNAYLAKLGPGAPVRTLKDIIRFNEEHRQQELQWFGQEELVKSEAKGPLTEQAYLDAVATCRRVARVEGIDAVMTQHHLDAIIAPTSGPAHVTDPVLGDHGVGDSTTPAAVAGYPSITVPAGQVHGLPVGLSFFAEAWSEPKLLRIAYAFEQATKARRPPLFLNTIQS